MPTAAQFNAAAKVLEDMVSGFEAMWKTLDGVTLNTGLEGDSPAQVQVICALDTSMTELGKAKTSIGDSAAELRRRAATCEQYVAAMSDYRRKRMEYQTHPDLVAKPVRPNKPFSWVEES